MVRTAVFLCVVFGGGLARANSQSNEPLIDAVSVVKGLVVDLRYATPDNFLKAAVYPPTARCLLRKSVADRLAQAALDLGRRQLRLKVYDCYRPRSVQWKMWKLFPKPGYVADPHYGSVHNRGAAVDLTLVDAQGAELKMPTAFDSFRVEAHHSFSGGSAQSRANRAILKEAMVGAGFKPNPMEWWHYEEPLPKRFRVLDEPF